jgi:hypothetical protein
MTNIVTRSAAMIKILKNLRKKKKMPFKFVHWPNQELHSLHNKLAGTLMYITYVCKIHADIHKLSRSHRLTLEFRPQRSHLPRGEQFHLLKRTEGRSEGLHP